MKGSELILDCLEKEGVDTVFGYPGGSVIPLFDALYDNKNIKVYRPCHEQGGPHAADGYARATGKPGVLIVTSGPGVTNAVTGIATAYLDSTPMVAITGNVACPFIGTCRPPPPCLPGCRGAGARCVASPNRTSPRPGQALTCPR